MKLTFTEAIQMAAELRILIDLLNSADARWDAVQYWLVEHPRWKAKAKKYTTCAPTEAVADLKAYIEEETAMPQSILSAFITPEIETQARSAIERLQTLYKERKAQDKPQAYISDEWIVDNSPIPSGHKSINDYQGQLKAKKKRRKQA